MLAVKAPDNFVCSISAQIMFDPVITLDGYSYENEAITQWLANHNTSPKTGAVLSGKLLTPNHDLKGAISEFLTRHPELWDEDVYFPESLQAEMRSLLFSSQKTWPQINTLIEKHPGFLTRPIHDGDETVLDKTVFHILCEQGPKEILQKLIERLKTDDKVKVVVKLAEPVGWRSPYLQTLFFDAVSVGDVTNAKLYQQLGADNHLQNSKGLTALELAHRSQGPGREAMIQFLDPQPEPLPQPNEQATLTAEESAHRSQDTGLNESTSWSATAWGVIALGASLAGAALYYSLYYYLSNGSATAPIDSLQSIASDAISKIPEPRNIITPVLNKFPDLVLPLYNGFFDNRSLIFSSSTPASTVPTVSDASEKFLTLDTTILPSPSSQEKSPLSTASLGKDEPQTVPEVSAANRENSKALFERGNSLYDEGKRLFQDKKFNEAEKKFKEAIQYIHENDINYRLMRGGILNDLGASLLYRSRILYEERKFDLAEEKCREGIESLDRAITNLKNYKKDKGVAIQHKTFALRNLALTLLHHGRALNLNCDTTFVAGAKFKEAIKIYEQIEDQDIFLAKTKFVLHYEKLATRNELGIRLTKQVSCFLESNNVGEARTKVMEAIEEYDRILAEKNNHEEINEIKKSAQHNKQESIVLLAKIDSHQYSRSPSLRR
jgi:tetratricopeptide (TPR) repeat protein